MGFLIDGYTVYVDIDDTLVSWDNAEVNYNCITEINKHFIRGHKIIFWSAGGGEWAKKAAEMAGISHMAAAFLNKPTRYFDDLPASEFMTEHRRKSFKED